MATTPALSRLPMPKTNVKRPAKDDNCDLVTPKFPKFDASFAHTLSPSGKPMATAAMFAAPHEDNVQSVAVGTGIPAVQAKNAAMKAAQKAKRKSIISLNKSIAGKQPLNFAAPQAKAIPRVNSSSNWREQLPPSGSARHSSSRDSTASTVSRSSFSNTSMAASVSMRAPGARGSGYGQSAQNSRPLRGAGASFAHGPRIAAPTFGPPRVAAATGPGTNAYRATSGIGGVRPVVAAPANNSIQGHLNGTNVDAAVAKCLEEIPPALVDVVKKIVQDLSMNSATSQQQAVAPVVTVTSDNGASAAALAQAQQQYESRYAEAEREIEKLKKALRNKTDDFEEEVGRHRRELERRDAEVQRVERQRANLELELGAARAEADGFRQAVAQNAASIAALNAQFDATKIQLSVVNSSVAEKDAKIAEQSATIERHLADLRDQAAKLRWGETERRRLHNLVQELRGNIRVFCRVRPYLEDEKMPFSDQLCGSHLAFPHPDHTVITLDKACVESLNETGVVAKANGGAKTIAPVEFTFDRVFEPKESQTDVFEEISQLVQSALDGYNVCIFAYGQTGSGKTFTMEGPDAAVVVEQPELAGMIPQSVKKVFETAASLKENGWTYELQASFLEIYNETCRDLLNPKADQKLEIKMPTSVTAADAEVTVANLTPLIVKSQADIEDLLLKAQKNRAVAATKCNEHSSRSHSIFRLRIAGRNRITGESGIGTLNLVDLAGSERLKESQSTGDRLKETQAINSSLSVLSMVIKAIAAKEQHVPFRNSKLTQLLSTSLGGNSKTLMFVNVNPREDCLNETLNSLRFAAQVNQCQIGTATKKTAAK